jgi:hypothetical protein
MIIGHWHWPQYFIISVYTIMFFVGIASGKGAYYRVVTSILIAFSFTRFTQEGFSDDGLYVQDCVGP